MLRASPLRKFLLLGGLFQLVFYPSVVHANEWLNEHLPEWVKLQAEFRHRYECKSDLDFNSAVDDDKGFSLYRTRVGLDLQPVEEVEFFTQFQDARIASDSIGGSKSAYENWSDIRQLWLRLKPGRLLSDDSELPDVSVSMGRQELSYGAQRLIGGFNWSNVAQTFDAGKLAIDFDKYKLSVDIFGGHKTLAKSPREFDDLYEGGSKDFLAGYYAAYKGIENLTIEHYVVTRNTDGKTVSFGQTGDGEVEDYTLGARIKGQVRDTGIDYELEAAKQFGNSGTLDVNAQMFIGIVGYNLDCSWNPRIAFEFDYASGDSDSSDSKRETFDNLYPTNHLYYGFMDLASLQNLINYHFQLSAKPISKLKLQSDLHLIYLDTPKDSLYAASRSIKRMPVAGADDHVGDEVDLTAAYQFNSYAKILLGYSHLFSGGFLKDTGSSADADYLYVQTTLSF